METVIITWQCFECFPFQHWSDSGGGESASAWMSSTSSWNRSLYCPHTSKGLCAVVQSERSGGLSTPQKILTWHMQWLWPAATCNLVCSLSHWHHLHMWWFYQLQLVLVVFFLPPTGTDTNTEMAVSILAASYNYNSLHWNIDCIKIQIGSVGNLDIVA